MYTALIIEFRKHNALEFVLNNFLTNLSLDWNFIIFHGNLNREFIQTIIDNKLAEHKNRITMVHIPYDNLLPTQYSKLLIEETIVYDNIPTETFLIFQTDAIILEKNKNNINDFLKYDYVGAPWSEDNDVGNGGLSLRKKSKMLEIIEKENPDRKGLPEDLFFARAESVQLYKPDSYEASRFSVENYLGCGEPFGCHKPPHYLTHLFNNYPILHHLYSLQNVSSD
jgi:hypothetical protein